MKKPDPIDVHVGGRIRLLRSSAKISQQKLGEHIGVSFQQIQKYEKGTNRVGSSNLLKIASFLGVDVGDLFDDVPHDFLSEIITAQDPTSQKALTNQEIKLARRLINSFLSIQDPQIQANIVNLSETLAKTNSE